jgi:hypothetical protein
MKENQEIQKTTTGDLSIGNQFSMKDFQAFYYKFNAKPDRETKFYKENKIVCTEDLLDLNKSIQEKLSLNNCITTKTGIITSFDNDRSLDFDNWTLFENYKWNTSSVIRSIIISWDFTIKVEGYENPQRHTAKLRIGTRIKPKDLMELVWNHDDETELHQALAHSICTIDYINPVISSEIFLIIENWHKALPNNFYSNKLHRFLTRHINKLEYLFIYLVLVTGCLLAFGASKVYLKLVWTNKFDQQFYYRIFGGLLLSFLFIHFLYYSSKYWSKFSIRKLDRLKSSNLFKITKGDNNQNEKAKIQNGGVVNKILLKLGITIIMTVASYFSHHIFDFIAGLIKN